MLKPSTGTDQKSSKPVPLSQNQEKGGQTENFVGNTTFLQPNISGETTLPPPSEPWKPGEVAYFSQVERMELSAMNSLSSERIIQE